MQLLENQEAHRTHLCHQTSLSQIVPNLFQWRPGPTQNSLIDAVFVLMATRKPISINQTSVIVKTEGNKKTASVAERRELDIT